MFYAINPDGTQKWAFLTIGIVFSSPAIGANGTIYMGSWDMFFHAINPDGTLKWEFLTGGTVNSSPAIGTDGTLYVGSADGNLYAIHGSSGGLSSDAPWPLFHHDLQHTGQASCPLPLGHPSYCTDCGPCGVGVGDCDGNAQCQSGLSCVNDVGANYGFPANIDVCESVSECPWPLGHPSYCTDCGPCGEGVGDCDGNSQCESGLSCVNDVGATYGFAANIDVCESVSGCPRPLGHPSYCTDCGPCGVGVGDCDGNSQCESGLSCVNDVGATYGFAANIDVCESVSGCPWPVGHPSYCSECGPCGVGVGDCDGNSQCESGLSCVNDVGATYGFAANIDVCESVSGCPFPVGHPSYCAECGPCGVGVGDCDGNSQCESGLSCVDDVGATYGFAANVDVCEVE